MKKLILAIISCVAVAALLGLKKKDKGNSATILVKDA